MPSRRSGLGIGRTGLLGMSFPQYLEAAEKPKAKHNASAKAVSFSTSQAAPSPWETFYPKPDAPDNVRGWHEGYNPLGQRAPLPAGLGASGTAARISVTSAAEAAARRRRRVSGSPATRATWASSST